MSLGKEKVLLLESLCLQTLVRLSIISKNCSRLLRCIEETLIAQLVLDSQLVAAFEHIHQFLNRTLVHQQGEVLCFLQETGL